jgi:hypothetical protein
MQIPAEPEQIGAITPPIASTSPIAIALVMPFDRARHRSAHQCASRPIAAATSAMRQEKPHSLSYQASTRTVRPPTTLV